jgi:hypothetical protein
LTIKNGREIKTGADQLKHFSRKPFGKKVSKTIINFSKYSHFVISSSSSHLELGSSVVVVVEKEAAFQTESLT